MSAHLLFLIVVSWIYTVCAK